MMSQFVQKWGHDIGYDPIFLDLRRKLYSGGDLLVVKSKNNQEKLSEFCLLTENDSLTQFKCLSPPASYFSSSFKNALNWTNEDWKLLFRAIIAKRGWHICRLFMLNDEQLKKVKSFCKRFLLPYAVSIDQFRMIPGNLNWEEYQKTRSGSFNRNQRRCQRLVEKENFQLTYEMSLEDLVFVYTERNTQRSDSNDYSLDTKFQEFFKSLRTQMISENRWYEVGIRDHEGKLCSFASGFWDQAGVFYLFQTAHNPQHRHLRLGAVNFDRLIEDVLTRGCKYLSFVSDAEYLRLFSDEVYRFHRIDIHSRTPIGFLLLFKKYGALIKNKLKTWKESFSS